MYLYKVNFEKASSFRLVFILSKGPYLIISKNFFQAKDVSEVTNKVRVKSPEDVSSCWQRMLQTIDGLGEAEVATVCSLIPRSGQNLVFGNETYHN